MSHESSITTDDAPSSGATETTSMCFHIGEYVRSGQVCVGIIEALATVLGTEPRELEPLYHAVDCDALEELFRTRRHGHQRSDFTATFDYDRLTITVTDDGYLAIEE